MIKRAEWIEIDVIIHFYNEFGSWERGGGGGGGGRPPPATLSVKILYHLDQTKYCLLFGRS
jgi:hypothetical protein